MKVFSVLCLALTAVVYGKPIADPNPVANIDRTQLASTLLSALERAVDCAGGEVPHTLNHLIPHTDGYRPR
jgi:hypothetical protein